MNFNEITVRILVRKDYGKCFDFYTEKMGLVPVWGDRNGPYTSFAISQDEEPCFAMFLGEAMAMYEGYEMPCTNNQPDSVVAIIPTLDLDKDYLRLKEAGVTFIGKPQFIEGWGMRCVYFRDPEGNLFELNDARGV